MRSALAETLGIDVSLLQAGMGGVAGPELACAVSEAGAGAADEGVGEPGEPGRLRARVADLESRLREHGIDPDEPGEAPAATG